MSEYLSLQEIKNIPRLPLEGSLDLTYRCPDNCRHCWLRVAPEAEDKKEELFLEEIKAIVDAARRMGCRRWSISGGEPMLRLWKEGGAVSIIPAMGLSAVDSRGGLRGHILNPGVFRNKRGRFYFSVARMG